MHSVTIHNPDRYMADLRQILSQGRKRLGLLVGAGAPTAIRVDADGNVVEHDGEPLIPNVSDLTGAVVNALPHSDRDVLKALEREIEGPINIETLLTQVRRLSQAIGNSHVHGLDSTAYHDLGQRMCHEVGKRVRVDLPGDPNPFSEVVSWISGATRTHSVELFTPNYDLLFEEAFERARVPFFDGFSGSFRPFFDAASVSSNSLPARWSKLWKIHGSLGWEIAGNTVVRTGSRESTELIYPDHLKYDQVTRLPYSALFERLRSFLTTPDTLLLCSGFSFLDSHICAVLDEAMAANSHTAILAFQYRTLEEEEAAVAIARSRPNMSVYARDGAVISGVGGRWEPGQGPNEDWEDIRQTFWQAASAGDAGEFLLGDFARFAKFLALAQMQRLASPPADSGGDGPESEPVGTERPVA